MAPSSAPAQNIWTQRGMAFGANRLHEDPARAMADLKALWSTTPQVKEESPAGFSSAKIQWQTAPAVASQGEHEWPLGRAIAQLQGVYILADKAEISSPNCISTSAQLSAVAISCGVAENEAGINKGWLVI